MIRCPVPTIATIEPSAIKVLSYQPRTDGVRRTFPELPLVDTLRYDNVTCEVINHLIKSSC